MAGTLRQRLWPPPPTPLQLHCHTLATVNLLIHCPPFMFFLLHQAGNNKRREKDCLAYEKGSFTRLPCSGPLSFSVSNQQHSKDGGGGKQRQAEVTAEGVNGCRVLPEPACLLRQPLLPHFPPRPNWEGPTWVTLQCQGKQRRVVRDAKRLWIKPLPLLQATLYPSLWSQP